MRYHIMHEGRIIAESEYADLAEAAVANSPVPVGLLDTFTGKLHEVERKAPNLGAVLSEDQLPWTFIGDQLFRGQKIQAIKLVRELTGLGLSDAKRVVDLHQDRLSREARERDTY